ncbi:MAG: iron transporter [Firmicutes bacterium]|nr:iron transporter [Bacillota bacterium]
MYKKIISVMMTLAVLSALLTGCGQKSERAAESPAAEQAACPLEDGIYTANFDTDSSMFHVNEACRGRGVLTVQNGEMTIHVSLAGTGILQLYPGLAEAAKQDEAGRLMPTTDQVTYSDGITEEVNGFDIPVPALDTEFDCALVGKKGTWYDHKVCVSDAKPYEEEAESSPLGQPSDGMTVEVVLSGGSGKTSVASPCILEQDETGAFWALVVFSSSNYDWMKLGEVQYEPVTRDPGSTFRIPVTMDADLPIQAQTSAMSTPHVIDYTLRFDSSTVKESQ